MLVTQIRPRHISVNCSSYGSSHASKCVLLIQSGSNFSSGPSYINADQEPTTYWL
jgi:hypothetical protein